MADTIYWSDPYDGAVRCAPLAPHGAVDTIFSGAQWSGDSPHGLAIDAAAGRIYWTNSFNNKIQRAPLAPGGAVETLYDKPAEPNKPGELSGPTGIAIHPAAGRIYWANSDDTIRRAPLTPHGAVETLTAARRRGSSDRWA
jgi:DNA-binding beta-propeller fold protein YncE